MKDKGFFKKKNKAIVVDVPYLEAYIPDFYFQSSYGEMKGSSVEVMGLFNYKVGKDGDNLKDEVHQLPFASLIEMLPSSIEKGNKKLFSQFPKKKYRILKFYKGDKFIKSSKVIQSVENVELFYKLFDGGKIPHGFTRKELRDLFFTNHRVNGMYMGDVKKMAFSFVVAESTRNKDDYSIPYRLSTNNPDGINYELPSTMDTVKSLNTFAALIGDDFNKMATASINRKHKGDSGAETPLEKIVRY